MELRTDAEFQLAVSRLLVLHLVDRLGVYHRCRLCVYLEVAAQAEASLDGCVYARHNLRLVHVARVYAELCAKHTRHLEQAVVALFARDGVAHVHHIVGCDGCDMVGVAESVRTALDRKSVV